MARPRGLGVHVSVAGGMTAGIERARALDLAAIQVFTKNSNQWIGKALAPDDVAGFRSGVAESAIRPAMAHASYLINLATADPELAKKSFVALRDELDRAEALGIDVVVLHPGAHGGHGEAQGLDRIARALDRLHRARPRHRARVALENAAGQGSCVGHRFEQLGAIVDAVDSPARIAVVVDTCHAFAAGYDLSTRDGWNRTIDELERAVGLGRVAGFHVNDSKKGLGSRVDRHQHIGQGALGLEAFRALMNDPRFLDHPKVLETPKDDDGDARNLALLESLIEEQKPRRKKKVRR